jgi:hypothetical protein
MLKYRVRLEPRRAFGGVFAGKDCCKARAGNKRDSEHLDRAGRLRRCGPGRAERRWRVPTATFVTWTSVCAVKPCIGETVQVGRTPVYLGAVRE